MATYRDIASTETDPQAPITSALMKALDANVDATAEGATDSPVNQTGWHPYNMVNVGDGNTGRFYDFATDGALATITTPTFADGYDYLVRWVGASPAGGTPVFQIGGVSVSGNIGGGASVTGFLEILAPTLLDLPKIGRLHFRELSGSNGIAPQSTAAASQFNGDFVFAAMASALTSVSFNFTAQNHDGGQYYLYRRRNFMFG